MTETVCVLGLGYVGLPLAVAFDQEDLSVIGYDVDETKVARLTNGEDPTGDVGDDTVAESGVQFTTEASSISDADYILITVPTPVDELGNPDLGFVEAAGQTIGEHISPGAVAVLESTVFPGATEDILVPAIESTSGLTGGEDFFVGYSPERASPGETGRGVRNVVKIVSGETDAVRDDLVELYEKIVDAGVYAAPNIQTAETAKVLENVQRDVNIALANELAVACEYLGLTTEDVLEAAGTKWNFHHYRPGLVGGHCIPVDPFYFIYRTKREGFSPKLVMQAREINEYMPKHVADMTLKELNNAGKVLRDSRVLVLGLAYKANVGDIRTSEVNGVIKQLKSYDVDVAGYDPHAEIEPMRDEFDIEILEELDFSDFDGIVLATGHDEFGELDWASVARKLNDSPVIVDVPSMLDADGIEADGFAYKQI
ncbi:nucleotide sugar dehydrogenase (plasmid) [Haloferacaceae archaeon DSL9]